MRKVTLTKNINHFLQFLPFNILIVHVPSARNISVNKPKVFKSYKIHLYILKLF